MSLSNLTFSIRHPVHQQPIRFRRHRITKHRHTLPSINPTKYARRNDPRRILPSQSCIASQAPSSRRNDRRGAKIASFAEAETRRRIAGYGLPCCAIAAAFGWIAMQLWRNSAPYQGGSVDPYERLRELWPFRKSGEDRGLTLPDSAQNPQLQMERDCIFVFCGLMCANILVVMLALFRRYTRFFSQSNNTTHGTAATAQLATRNGRKAT